MNTTEIKSVAALVTFHNAIPGVRPIAIWKRSRADLVAKIEAAQQKAADAAEFEAASEAATAADMEYMMAKSMPTDDAVMNHFAAQQADEANESSDEPTNGMSIVDVAMEKGVSPAALAELAKDKLPGEVMSALCDMPTPDVTDVAAVVAALGAPEAPVVFATWPEAEAAAVASGEKDFHITRTEGGFVMVKKEKNGAAAPTWPKQALGVYYVKKAEAVADAKRQFGADAQEKVDFVISKLARKHEVSGGVYFWVSMEEVDAKWSNKDRHEAGLAPKKRAATKNVAPAEAKTGKAKAPKAAKAQKADGAPRAKLANGANAPKAGSDTENALRQLMSPEGMTTKSIEAELTAKHGKPVHYSAGTAKRLAEQFNMTWRSEKDADGAVRFWLS